MPLFPAAPADLPAVVELVNSAYRGESGRRGWTTESDILGGQRTDVERLKEELASEPDAQLLLLRDGPEAPLLGCVWLQSEGPSTWYLGMLTVRPELQAAGHGRRMIEAAEALARAAGVRRMRMTVISLRESLIAWYRRRGYAATGETKPFPYGNERWGLPLRDDIEFLVLEKVLERAPAT